MVPDNEGLSAAGCFAGSLFDCAGLGFAGLVSGVRLLWHPAKLMSKARPSNVRDGFLISCIEFSRDGHYLAGPRRFVFVRWFVCVAGCRSEVNDENQPCHQAAVAPPSRTKTNATTNAALIASRRMMRAMNSNATPTTRRTRPVAIAVTTDVYLLLTAFGPAITRAHGCFDVAAYVEIAFEFYAERIARVHKIFEDHVDDVLVKNLHVAKRVDVELQTL